MIELDDCGRELHLHSYSRWAGASMDVTIQMIIKVPRGTLTLFNHNNILTNLQCKAIRAFMEEHNDTT